MHLFSEILKFSKLCFLLPLFLCEGNLYAQELLLGAEKEGLCSFYSDKFEGLKTYSGEFYSKSQYTAAHKYLPMNTILAVFNLKSNKYIIVRVNDRGPHRKTRLIDISGDAAAELGIKRLGITKVRIKVLGFKSFQNLDPIDPPGNEQEVLNEKEL